MRCRGFVCNLKLRSNLEIPASFAAARLTGKRKARQPGVTGLQSLDQSSFSNLAPPCSPGTSRQRPMARLPNPCAHGGSRGLGNARRNSGKASSLKIEWVGSSGALATDPDHFTHVGQMVSGAMRQTAKGFRKRKAKFGESPLPVNRLEQIGSFRETLAVVGGLSPIILTTLLK